MKERKSVDKETDKASDTEKTSDGLYLQYIYKQNIRKPKQFRVLIGVNIPYSLLLMMDAVRKRNVRQTTDRLAFF